MSMKAESKLDVQWKFTLTGSYPRLMAVWMERSTRSCPFRRVICSNRSGRKVSKLMFSRLIPAAYGQAQTHSRSSNQEPACASEVHRVFSKPPALKTELAIRRSHTLRPIRMTAAGMLRTSGTHQDVPLTCNVEAR